RGTGPPRRRTRRAGPVPARRPPRRSRRRRRGRAPRGRRGRGVPCGPSWLPGWVMPAPTCKGFDRARGSPEMRKERLTGGGHVVLRVSGEVREALDAGRPVVALESTIIAHGLPRPRNLQVAVELEAAVREEGAVPATIAVLDGVPRVGLDKEQLERVANEDGIRKLGHRDLALAAAGGASGATTVSATALLAALAGVRVFATGGLGGVHREWTVTQDESADLGLLARTRITVVCAGVKSILDVAASLQRLETLRVAGVGGGRVAGTGGLGGLHRECTWTQDESADLGLRARTRITVVCAGVKSILDVAATLQRLETLGVAVAGYGTDRFPGFYLSD